MSVAASVVLNGQITIDRAIDSTREGYTGKHNGDRRDGEIPPEYEQYAPGGKDKPKRPAESEASDILRPAYENRFTFDDIAGEWYRYNGTHWEQASKLALVRAIKSDLSDRVPQGFGYSYVSNIQAFLAADLEVEQWSDSRELLPMQNGVLNIKTRQLTPHRPDFWFNWALPYSYDPTADCPTFKTWLYEATARQRDVIQLLRAFMKATVTARVDLQKYLELIGPGGSGKSTFLNLIMAMVGDENAVATELRQLEQNRFETAALYGKRLAVLTDQSRYGGDVDTLKAMTGQDLLRLERKGRQQGPGFRFGGMVLLAANEPIQTTDYTSGLIRRRISVNFAQRIPDAKRDPNLFDKLKAELPGVLNWCLALTDEQVTEIIRNPGDTTRRARMQMIVDTNPLAAWIDERTIAHPADMLKVGDKDAPVDTFGIPQFAYANYLDWCEKTGHKAVGLNRFDSRKSSKDDLIGFSCFSVIAIAASGEKISVRVPMTHPGPHGHARPAR